MLENNKKIVREFFEVLPSGNVPTSLFTEDMRFWSISGGTADMARFLGGAKLLAAIFDGGLNYQITSLTAEEDRVVAEIKSSGTLITGEAFNNSHVFSFRIKDGRIAAASEFMDMVAVREKLLPLMQQAAAAASKS